ncbi:MAG: GGDEF domain-containing protein [Wenzhouxiangellaceae bacterium]|nr:GGDEF domain-containing protein [Wenzhouxiangellaceae bacterium]
MAQAILSPMLDDRPGHFCGDRILVELTEIVRSTLRAADRCYRFGGDEFVLLLPGTDADGLRPALDKLVNKIRAELESPEGPMTVSIGATDLGPDDTPNSWLARADQALYRAKQSGRDRVEIL